MQTGIDDALEERAREAAAAQTGARVCDTCAVRKVCNQCWVTDPADRERRGLAPLERRRCAHAMFTAGCSSCALDAKEQGPSQRADPATMLFGDDAATLDAFGQVCAALEEHAEKAQALQVAYRNALEQVSRMAARRNRSK